MAKIREKDRLSIMNAIAGGVTPRQGIQHIQVGRLEETAAILSDIEQVKQGGGAVRIIQASYGSGKKLPLDALILTEFGWKENKDICIGDRIYNRDGILTTVKYISETTSEYIYELELSDGRILECCKDHQWIVNFPSSLNGKHYRAEKIMTVLDMLEKGLKISGSYRFHIPLIKPVQFPERNLPLDPYVVGALLGDGCCLETALTISSGDDTIPNMINDIINPKGCVKRNPHNYHWTFYTTPEKIQEMQDFRVKQGKRRATNIKRLQTDFMLYRLPELCHDANEKRIPTIYLLASVEQRLSLLQGLLDTDGTANKGRISFSTNSRQLALDVQDLARSLGFAASMRYDLRNKYKNKEKKQYVVSIWTKDINVFRLQKKKDNLIKYMNARTSNRKIRNSDDVSIKNIKRTRRKTQMQCIAVSDDTHSYITNNYTMTHNTFFLTLSKTVALKQNMLVMSADLSPDRRLYASDGKANNLYRELVRNLSSVMHPDGGALEELLNTVDEKVINGDAEFLAEIRKLPYGYDAVSVCNKWHQANNPITDKEKRDAFIVKDACLRWFAGENTTEHKKLLGVRSSIGDEGAWDALKMIAMLGHFAGYAGLLVEFDECVNLYKINNSTSRDRNYEQILRIFNECLQGDAKYIGVIFSGTPEFVMDPRRGLFSYDALKSRLVSSEYADKTSGIDTSGPVIDLMPLSQEDLLILLGNLTNVEALGNKDEWLLDNDQMMKFLERQYQELGADYYRTPRQLLRSFVMLLKLIKENPDMDINQALGTYEVKSDKRESGLGAAMTDTLEPNNSIIDAVDDEDFGF